MRFGCSEALGVWLFPLGSWFSNARVLLIIQVSRSRAFGRLGDKNAPGGIFRLAYCAKRINSRARFPKIAAINAHISK